MAETGNQILRKWYCRGKTRNPNNLDSFPLITVINLIGSWGPCVVIRYVAIDGVHGISAIQGVESIPGVVCVQGVVQGMRKLFRYGDGY